MPTGQPAIYLRAKFSSLLLFKTMHLLALSLAVQINSPFVFSAPRWKSAAPRTTLFTQPVRKKHETSVKIPHFLQIFHKGAMPLAVTRWLVRSRQRHIFTTGLKLSIFKTTKKLYLFIPYGI